VWAHTTVRRIRAGNALHIDENDGNTPHHSRFHR
jgi:hypothetical protein